MKKITRLSFVAMLIFSLVLITGCGNSGDKTVFERKKDGLESVLTYYHEGDKVTKQTTMNKVNYEVVNLKDKKDAEAKLVDAKKAYEGIDGLKYDIKLNEKDLVETIEVDYEKLDYDKAKNIPNFTSDGDIKAGVSLKKSEELLKKSGYKKIEK